ncbi:MAG: hypothetical protein ACOCUF_00165 [Patescibacteria group bacterium]
MKNQEKESNSRWANFLLAFLDGFIKKLSLNVVFNVKKQVDEFVFKIKSGFLIAVFLLAGLIFLLGGMVVLLNDALNLFPGDGYFLMGVLSIFIAALIGLMSKVARR